MKVYLAKSNKSNMDTLIHVRSVLNKLDCEILQHEGGTYSNRSLIESDVLLVIPETLLDSTSARIGKGLHGQIEDFKITNSLKKAFVISMTMPGTFGINKIISTEVYPKHNYVNYGLVHFQEEPELVTKEINRKSEEIV